MALKFHFDKNASLAEQMAIVAQAEADIITAMQYAGEKFVKEARLMKGKANGGFDDHTGNLRSSIGYFIFKDGKAIDKMVYLSDKGIDRQKGVDTAEKLAGQLAKPVGLQLIGMAGMDYASHVESLGYNVISVQADAAIIDLTRYFKVIESKYNRR